MNPHKVQWLDTAVKFLGELWSCKTYITAQKVILKNPTLSCACKCKRALAILGAPGILEDSHLVQVARCFV